METPISTARNFASFAKREDFLNSHLCRVQVKLLRTDLGTSCFLKVGNDVFKLFPADKSERLLFFGEFYSSKAEESISVFFRDPRTGKEVFDSPKKRTCKLSADKKGGFRYVSYEWLWGLSSGVLRLLHEEPRAQPQESSTAVVCFSFDPDELETQRPPPPAAPEQPAASAGRGSGRESAPGSPGESGRGRGRRDTIDGGQGGRGRGLPRRESMGSSGESDQLALVRRRISSGSSEKELQLPQFVAPANSVIEASVNRFVELCNAQQDGAHHVLISTGALPVQSSQVEGPSELVAKRLLARAIEKKHNLFQYKDILQESFATDEFYMFCNLRLLLTRSGVAKCVLVAREVDCERLLMLWTSVMVGLKISITTCPVPTPELKLAKAKLEANAKSHAVIDHLAMLRKA